jgi:DNA-binding SARP family transcriptional activator
MGYRLLGPLAIEAGHGEHPVGSRRARFVLAMLLLHRNAPVSGDALFDVIWGDRPPARAAAGLRVVISRLRRQVEPDRGPHQPSVLTHHPAGWRLAVPDGALDADRFEDRMARSQRALVVGDWARAGELARAALAEWRGPALADVVDDLVLARAPAARWEEQRLVAAERAAEADIGLGRHHAVTGELAALVEAHPFRERFVSLLMVALYRSGRQAEALRAYHGARLRLVEELGIEPTAALVALERAILDQDPALDAVLPGEPGPRVAIASVPPPAVEGSGTLSRSALSLRFAEVGPGPWQQATERALSDGHQAMAAGDHDKAVTRFDAARQLIERSGRASHRAHAEVLLALGRARMEAGDRAVARDSLRVAIAEAHRGGWNDLGAEAVLTFAGEMAWLSDEDDGEVLALMRDVYHSLSDDQPALRARVATRLAAVTAIVTGPDSALDISAEALSLARALGLPDGIARALHIRHNALYYRWPPRDRLRLVDEAVRLLVRGTDFDVTMALYDRVLILLELGPRADVDAALAALARQTTDSRAPGAWLAAAMEAGVTISRGDLDRGEAMAATAWEKGWLTGAADAAQVYSVQLVALRLFQGRLGELVEAIDGEVRRRPDLVAWSALLAMARAEQGDLVGARAEVERIVAALDREPRGYLWLPTVAVAADAVAVIGRPAGDLARPLLDHLAPFAGRHIFAGRVGVPLGPCDRYQAGLLAACGAVEDALVAYGRAAAMADEAGMVPYAELARWGVLSCSGGDPGHRRDGLVDLRRSAADRGHVLVVRRSDALIADIDLAEPARPAG